MLSLLNYTNCAEQNIIISVYLYCIAIHLGYRDMSIFRSILHITNESRYSPVRIYQSLTVTALIITAVMCPLDIVALANKPCNDNGH